MATSNMQAVVLLHPLDFSGPVFDRTLTFTSESDRIEIGRSSQRASKDLSPRPNNALFDSRVMSRVHAILRVSLNEKVVYVRDPGSMHGTWLNKRRVPVETDMALSDGDVLTFGVEVIRGSDTFPPLEVRCESQFEETRKEALPKASHQTASNTFSVPDDDDDEYDDHNYDDEYDDGEHRAAVDLTVDRASESNDSSAGSDSDDSRSVVEVASPMTSPLKNWDLKNAGVTDSSAAVPTQGALQDPTKPNNGVDLDSEQILATPRMTPPSDRYESDNASYENPYADEYFARNSDEESTDDWDVGCVEGDEEEDEDENEEQEIKEAVDANPLPDTVCETSEPAIHAQKESRIRFSDLINAEDDLDDAAAVDCEKLPLVNTISDNGEIQAHDLNLLPECTFAGTGSQQVERQIHGASFYSTLNPPYSSFEALKESQPPLQSSGNLPDHYRSNIFPTGTILPPIKPSIEHTPRYYPGNISSYSEPMGQYNDGPFATNQPMPDITVQRSPATSGSAVTGFMPFMDRLAPMMPRTSCDATVPVPESDMRANISAQSPEPSEWKGSGVESKPTSSKKRKAAEIESDPAERDNLDSDMAYSEEQTEAQKLPNEDTQFPDAQPQSIAAILNSPDSQLTPVSIPESARGAKETKKTKNTRDGERPSKMVKTSHGGSVRSHATTAILGAVVGAVGTIAALASLPPDYFA